MKLSFSVSRPNLEPHLQEKYDLALQLNNIFNQVCGYWFTKSAKQTNRAIRMISTQISNYIHALVVQHKITSLTFTQTTIKRAIRTPNLYTGDIDWFLLRKQALEIYKLLVL